MWLVLMSGSLDDLCVTATSFYIMCLCSDDQHPHCTHIHVFFLPSFLLFLKKCLKNSAKYAIIGSTYFINAEKEKKIDARHAK